mmetsp:Transcript_87959/g.138861  ORF Transcript_87959/g.138861 Transcript_87959/m.138861 type:complete len:208 (-) Transcript_87959:905-1528(-)
MTGTFSTSAKRCCSNKSATEGTSTSRTSAGGITAAGTCGAGTSIAGTSAVVCAAAGNSAGNGARNSAAAAGNTSTLDAPINRDSSALLTEVSSTGTSCSSCLSFVLTTGTSFDIDEGSSKVSGTSCSNHDCILLSIAPTSAALDLFAVRLRASLTSEDHSASIGVELLELDELSSTCPRISGGSCASKASVRLRFASKTEANALPAA